ncbi:MAG: 16S rRNA (guanine(527)-N(7))-methyltransferase RsmG [Methylobacillus sp.]|jgi:16S rRNA (guanine527-N7)-methyltransferase|nr:16S rRNA (guanine(527)-N(7))-methyltransferase RsmG [Methylobacillus sp.]
MSLQEKLVSGLQALDIAPDTAPRLLEYLALLEKWNKVHNLTAVRDPDEMVTLHLLDSLSVLPHIGQGRLLDVGSGAGLPGIPLAMIRPDLQVTVLDSSHKKTSFMRQAKAVLELNNLEVVCGRVEEFRVERKFDMIISRAFSDLAEFMRLTRHLCADGGVWLAMKGVYPHEELAQVTDATEVVPLAVPGLEAQRHLVFLKAA